ncbi:Probable LRR receptor-like serine/threonine-protein kinase At5g63710 [Linum perenne]
MVHCLLLRLVCSTFSLKERKKLVCELVVAESDTARRRSMAAVGLGICSCHHLIKLLLSCLLLLNLVTTKTQSSQDPDIEGEALIKLRKALHDSNSQITDWNYFFVSPCNSWSHVTCRNGSVVSLSLGSKGFTGTLSPEITKLKSLITLELQDNNLSGPLPEYLGSMTHLQVLNLANNNFNGSIPTTWDQLSNLNNLDISSNAAVMGNIPRQLFKVGIFNFTGTRLECGLSLEEPCYSTYSLRAAEAASVKSSKSRLKIILSASSAAFALVLLGVGYLACRYYRLRKHLNQDIFIRKVVREKRLEEIVDRNLDREDYEMKEVERMVQVALLCTQSSPEERPMMGEVVKMLGGEGYVELEERWAEWEQVEDVRNEQDFSLLFANGHHHFDNLWTDDSNQEAIQLSKPR